MTIDPRLIALAIAELPTLIAAIRSKFVQDNPGDPAPTDADVHAALEQAYQSSLATDEAWLAAHPSSEQTPPAPSAATPSAEDLRVYQGGHAPDPALPATGDTPTADVTVTAQGIPKIKP